MLNRCDFIGNIGKQPEIRFTSSGAKVANFSLAVSESWKDKSGQKQERTEWVNVVAWNEGLVGVIEKYLSKGSKVFISGKMQTRKWEDKSGTTKYMTEIVLQGFDAKLIMLGGKGDKQETPAESNDDFGDDIPF